MRESSVMFGVTAYRLKSAASSLFVSYSNFIIKFIEFHMFKIIARILSPFVFVLKRSFRHNKFVVFTRPENTARKILTNSSASIDEMREVAARICRDYLHGAWKTVSSDDIKFRRISGGLSNFLYYVSLPDDCDNNNSTTPLSQESVKRLRRDSSHQETEPKEVLLRIYGQSHGDSAMLTELVVFTLLSERNLGPKLHGIFPGGRIEQYIPARALKTHELSRPCLVEKIAEKMAEIHSLNIPISKEPEWIWKTMGRWLKNSKSILESPKHDCTPHQRNIIQEIRKTDLSKEVAWLKDHIFRSNYPVVFSHNDMQEGNILVKGLSATSDRVVSMDIISSDSEPVEIGQLHNGWLRSNNNGPTVEYKDVLNGIRSAPTVPRMDNATVSPEALMSNGNDDDKDDCDLELIIIDYEYCAYNYRGFDIANHFIEWTIDYTAKEYPYYSHRINQYPTLEQRTTFIEQYLKTTNDSDMYTPSKDEMDAIMEEISCFTMASHLFWGLWSIINVYQLIEFGYCDYALTRLQQYHETKKEFIENYIMNKPLHLK